MTETRQRIRSYIGIINYNEIAKCEYNKTKTKGLKLHWYFNKYVLLLDQWSITFNWTGPLIAIGPPHSIISTGLVQV